ncbi:MAG: BTAD domain-containing putative transcriptional regulator, partial [Gemmatimonadaceae bacterium]
SLLAQPKRVALVVYLALASPRGPHRRDVLLSLFWPELDSEHARNALSQSMHFLRRTLGAQTLVNKGSELSLACEKLWCDAIAFEEAIASGHASEALELYRGDLLEGFHVGNAPEFERWLETERTRLADVYLRAARAVAEKRDLADDHEAAVALWKRLATRDPYSSQVAIGYMRALAASADRTGALQHARVYESLLREELNAEPDRGVMALAHQLQSAPRAAEKPARQAAPPPVLQPVAEKLVLPPAAPSAMPASVVAEPRNGTSSIAVAEKKSRYPRYFSSIAATLVLLLIAVGGAVAFRVGPHADARAEIRSLAVLPFEDLTGDSSQRSFAEGMHEALIAELARYPELRVISRTSVLRYRSTTKSLPEIARELRVDGVVEGAVLRDGGRIRMNAQLVHAPSDHEVWAEHYVRDLRDILVLQSELAAAIAGEVHVAIHPVPRPSIDRSGAADAPPRELYLRELYLRGRHAEISRSLNGLETAREAYRRAIAEDSAFALGWAGLAAVYGFMADYGYAPMQPMLDSARMLALRAVALDSTLPETRAAFAVTLGDAHNFAGAEREFRRAIELGPSNARAHYWYSVLLVALGRGDEALREAERALELDPFSPRGGTAMKRYATFLLTGQYPHLKLPVNERRPILKLEPGEPWARAREATDWAQAGRCQEARSEIARARQGAPGENFRMLPSVATVHWWCGHRDSTRAILARMKKLPRAGENGYRVALVHILLGERDSVFVWLERQRWTMAELSGLSADSQLQPIRTDPRYAALLQRLGIRARS